MTNEKSDLTVPLAVASEVPRLLRLGVLFLRMKAKRRRGVRAFRRTLISGGMDRMLADRLAEEYASYGRLRSYLRGALRLRPLPFSF